jgi:hypothetical protein
MRLYENSTHVVLEIEAGFYEVWTHDESEFVEGYPSESEAINLASRLEEESAE